MNITRPVALFSSSSVLGGGEKKEEEEERKNPFYISRSISESLSRYEEGFVRFLPRFTEISELFRHLECYRFEICEANTRAFVIPHHADVETIFFVSQGRGTVTLVKQNQRESYEVEKGDVMKVDAGTTVYTINHSDKERLQMVKLVQSRNAPGDYEIYFGAGGENPKSFYRVFSDEVLEAAFNTTRDGLHKVFEQQTRGAVVGASEEQIKALTQHAKSSKGSKAEGKGPFNLLQSPAIHSNKFGQLFEVTPSDLKGLQDLDSSVSFVQLNQGGMMAPFFNSKATKIVYVVEGDGSFEILSPQGQGSPFQSRGEVTKTVHYEKFNGRLLPGVMVVVPAGYPVTFVASQSENLQLVAFGVNAQNNEKHFLAGKESILNQLEREALELSFNTRAEEVEQILNNQKDSYFVAASQGVWV
ncbi:Cupin 1 [Dillenia turbinata]|uniref:Cupin 1 n=1 Tax=Dillenia turbinata TaxID=194707 RepID=A0AAN8YV71_9MAGN